MASAFNLSGLTDYVNVHRDELLTKATLDAKTLRYVDIMPNVKYKDAIPTLSSSIQFQDGSACGFNPMGEDEFGELYIETKAVKVEKEWCYKDWEKKYGNYQLLWEAGRETLPFEEKIANHNLALVQEALEETVWQGNSGVSIDGFIKNIEDASASTIAVSGLTSASTIVEKVDAIVAAIPAVALRKGVNLFMSETNLRNYILGRNAACCFRDPIDAAAGELTYPGDSRVKLVAVYGIGEKNFVAAPLDAMVYATDIENAENVYKLWFNDEAEMFRFRVLFRAGTALRYADEIVYLFED